MTATVSAVVVLASGFLSVGADRAISRLGRVDAIPRPGDPGVPVRDIDDAAQNVLIAASSADARLAAVAILHLPHDGARPILITLPPGASADIPGRAVGRLDTTSGRLLVQSVDELTGLTIDRFVHVDTGRLPTAAAVLAPVTSCPATSVDAPLRHVVRHLASARFLLDPIRVERTLAGLGSAVQIDERADPIVLAHQVAAFADARLAATTIPARDEQGTLDAGDVRDFVAHLVARPDDFDMATARMVSPSTVHAVVLNASPDGDAAQTLAATLRTAGFAVDTVGQTAASPTTVVRYPIGMQDDARTVGVWLPGARMIATNAVGKVTVVLGGHGVGSAATAGSACGA